MASRKPKARYLQVKKWWEFQHYPDKVEQGWTPTWIKAKVSLLDDYDFNALSEVNRGRLQRIWLLAARLNNKIPWDEHYIRTAIRAPESFRLAPFLEGGWLLPWDESAAQRPPRPQKRSRDGLDAAYNGSSPEKSREELKDLAVKGAERKSNSEPRSVKEEIERSLKAVA